MIKGIHNKLREHIITLLATTPNITETDIEQKLLKMKIRGTTQGIYRCLRELQEDGVIVKENQIYSLRLAWIMDVAFLIRTMERTYFTGSYLEKILPKLPGEQRRWHFTNLLKMDDFWSQVLIAMAEGSNSKIALNYSPHVWYDVMMAQKENQFAREYVSLLKYEYTIIGSRSFLDKYCEVARDIPAAEIYYFATPEECIEKERGKYICVLDDYVLTIRLDKKTTELMEEIYAKVTQKEQFTAATFMPICTNKANIKMMLEYNRAKALTYYKKFTKIFGPLGKNIAG